MKRIFTKDEWEELSLNDEIINYGFYRRYHLSDGSVNPEFRSDIISGRILDLKQGNEKALNFFYGEINDLIEKDVTICVVPSHEVSDSNTSGVAELARRLANSDRIDKVDCLLRTKTIDKLAYGGSRDYNLLKNSISFNNSYSIDGEVVLIVDDVTTSGNSLLACKSILEENGASRVAMFAIGKSI